MINWLHYLDLLLWQLVSTSHVQKSLSVIFRLKLSRSSCVGQLFSILLRDLHIWWKLFLMLFLTDLLGVKWCRLVLNYCTENPLYLFEVLKYSLEQYIGFVGRLAFIHYCCCVTQNLFKRIIGILIWALHISSTHSHLYLTW